MSHYYQLLAWPAMFKLFCVMPSEKSLLFSACSNNCVPPPLQTKAHGYGDAILCVLSEASITFQSQKRSSLQIQLSAAYLIVWFSSGLTKRGSGKLLSFLIPVVLWQKNVADILQRRRTLLNGSDFASNHCTCWWFDDEVQPQWKKALDTFIFLLVARGHFRLKDQVALPHVM